MPKSSGTRISLRLGTFAHEMGGLLQEEGPLRTVLGEKAALILLTKLVEVAASLLRLLVQPVCVRLLLSRERAASARTLRAEEVPGQRADEQHYYHYRGDENARLHALPCICVRSSGHDETSLPL